jgi:hypothetical protein
MKTSLKLVLAAGIGLGGLGSSRLEWQREARASF